MTKNSKKVLIFGTFDALHPGHISLMRYAQQFGEVTTVIARDATVRHLRHAEPFFAEEERLTHVQALGLVRPVLGSETDPYAVLDTHKPDVIVLGYDQTTFTERLETILVEKNIPAKIHRAPALRDDIFKSRRLKRALRDAEAGFLYLNKAAGMTSHDVIWHLRKKLGIKKIGHAGTLDPLATGVLICAVGHATTLLDWWHVFPKTYTATLELGKTSDTYDSDGTITETENHNIPDREMILKTLSTYTGEIEQTPPPFSAKKINGKKAYQLARQGKEMELTPQKVHIDAIHLDAYTYPHATITVTCSTGTYIRSIIHDLGNALGCGAIMTTLERSAIGPVSLDTTTTLEGEIPKVSVHEFQEMINQHFLSATLPT